MLLGTDAHIDLGGLLKSISPGTAGGVDFGLAAAGAMNPAPGLPANAQGRTPNGVTLSMLGGVLPQPQSKNVSNNGLSTARAPQEYLLPAATVFDHFLIGANSRSGTSMSAICPPEAKSDSVQRTHGICIVGK